MLYSIHGNVATRLREMWGRANNTAQREHDDLRGLQESWNEDTGTGTCAEVAPGLEGRGGGEKERF